MDIKSSSNAAAINKLSIKYPEIGYSELEINLHDITVLKPSVLVHAPPTLILCGQLIPTIWGQLTSASESWPPSTCDGGASSLSFPLSSTSSSVSFLLLNDVTPVVVVLLSSLCWPFGITFRKRFAWRIRNLQTQNQRLSLCSSLVLKDQLHKS